MKLTDNYNQYLDYRIRNSCTIVTFLNILKYNYWIFVIPNFFIKITIFLEKLWFISLSKWATFWIIYPAMVRNLNKKLWLKFKLIKTTIPKLKENNKFIWSLWIKKYSTRRYWRLRDDWDINMMDLDTLVEISGWIWHNLAYTPKMWWKIIDTKWENPQSMSIEVLKKWYEYWLFRATLRTIVPANLETWEVVKLTKKMARAEYRWILDNFNKHNFENPYFEKAQKLYLYWR